VKINLWVAAGEDMQWMQPIQRPGTRSFVYPTSLGSLGTWVPQDSAYQICDVEVAFQSPFPALVPFKQYSQKLVCGPQQPQDLRELLKRFEQYTDTITVTNAGFTVIDTYKPTTAAFPDSTWNLFSSYFIALRGGCHYKFVRAQDSANPPGVFVVTQGINKSGSVLLPGQFVRLGRGGIALEDSDMKTSVELHLPWHSKFSYVSVTDGFNDEYEAGVVGITFWPKGSVTTTKMITFWALDDSFMFGLPACFPAVQYDTSTPIGMSTQKPKGNKGRQSALGKK